jgi:hypothetical protein
MTTISNRFFRGMGLNTGNPRSHFQYFAIDTVKEIKDYEGGVIFDAVKDAEDYFSRDETVGEPFYVVFGSFKADHVQSGMHIATFDNLSDAVRLVEMLTGNPIEEKQ